jgi:hypothetical protein
MRAPGKGVHRFENVIRNRIGVLQVIRSNNFRQPFVPEKIERRILGIPNAVGVKYDHVAFI